MYNNVVLIGRLTADSDLKSIGAQKMLRFSLAVNTKRGQKEKTLFIDCDFWGERSEKIAPWMMKGKVVLVEGTLDLDIWEKDGVPQRKIFVNVNNVEFISASIKGDE